MLCLHRNRLNINSRRINIHPAKLHLSSPLFLPSSLSLSLPLPPPPSLSLLFPAGSLPHYLQYCCFLSLQRNADAEPICQDVEGKRGQGLYLNPSSPFLLSSSSSSSSSCSFLTELLFITCPPLFPPSFCHHRSDLLLLVVENRS